ncbi:hypothetical protein A9Q93_11955 [Nonlabens dokdonensis]|uniref:DUF3592 domain-containing protein n=1 Tax=Nonlabens dokdonensis TaxID=328515 RepID=A0A1Z8AL90_9FLAO|nr:hypothetical protein [Nonlabens dokdonensis]OUS11097.1 hypothetical protein A9Q93_11955 [Nonlabens dokdonensis]
MNNTPRKVTFSTILNILKKKPIPMLFGFLFTLLPLFLVIILSIVFSSIGNDTPKVDYELINSQGRENTAIITDIETQYNVTINGVHPTIISYKYSDNGKEIESKYKVLEDRKIEKLEIGNDIKIKELNGSSIVKDLKPYGFSTGFFLIFPIPFLIIGLPFLIYSLLNLKKELKLYKLGKVSKGKIVSMMPKSGLPVSNVGQGIIVHYEYETRNGNKIIGESFTTDFSIMSDKKKGDLIPIFVSNENDEKSCVVPKLQSLRNGWNINFE